MKSSSSKKTTKKCVCARRAKKGACECNAGTETCAKSTHNTGTKSRSTRSCGSHSTKSCS